MLLDFRPLFPDNFFSDAFFADPSEPRLTLRFLVVASIFGVSLCFDFEGPLGFALALVMDLGGMMLTVWMSILALQRMDSYDGEYTALVESKESSIE
jgi:hypothetical protein